MNVGPPPARARATASRDRIVHGQHVDAIHRHRRHPVGLGPLRGCRAAAAASRAATAPNRSCSRRRRSPAACFSAAKFRLSDVTPSSVVASPRNTTTTRSSPLHLRGERRTGGDRNGAADDRGGAGHADALVDEVHRAAARSDAAVDAAVHLAQHRPQVAALGEIGAVRAMARYRRDRSSRSAAQHPTAAASWPITR